MNEKKAAGYFSERLIDVKIDFFTFQQYASHYFSRACNNSDKSFTRTRIVGKETVSTLKLTRTTTSLMSCTSLVCNFDLYVLKKLTKKQILTVIAMKKIKNKEQ